MNPKTLQTIFRFDRRWIYDDYDDIENKNIYTSLWNVTAPIHPSKDSLFDNAAFIYAMKTVTYEFLLPDDERGRVNLEEFSNALPNSLRDITDEQLMELWKYLYGGELRHNTETEEYIGSRGRVISETMTDDVVAQGIVFVTEVQLERIRTYLRHAVPKKFWYELERVDVNDPVAYEQVDNKMKDIL